MDWNWLTTPLSKFNPNDLPGTAVLIIILLGLWRFTNTSLWPFITDKVWPAFVEAQKLRLANEAHEAQERTTVITTLRDAVVEIKSISSHLLVLIQTLSNDQRESMTILTAQQQSIMQRLMLAPMPGETNKAEASKS
jgi:hypothetical protein